MGESMTWADLAGTVPAGVVFAAASGVALFAALVLMLAARRQRRAVVRLEERVAQLASALSLLTNTTEEGLRGVAIEVSRLAGKTEAASPRRPEGVRDRIAAAASHGLSVRDIAAAEQVSEGEVLLHLLVDRLRKPEHAHAEMC